VKEDVMAKAGARCSIHDGKSLRRKNAAAPSSYLEFARRPDLSVGYYVLEPGEMDPQLPHSEDEVYVIVAGAAGFLADGSVHPIGPGDVIEVPAGVDHRFVDVVERLEVVVVFGPAEGSRA
jgi:mannose-6-phosphate isomerase-like protein (cupin superfamily)